MKSDRSVLAVVKTVEPPVLLLPVKMAQGKCSVIKSCNLGFPHINYFYAECLKSKAITVFNVRNYGIMLMRKTRTVKLLQYLLIYCLWHIVSLFKRVVQCITSYQKHHHLSCSVKRNWTYEGTCCISFVKCLLPF